jgi:hypothetical protein
MKPCVQTSVLAKKKKKTARTERTDSEEERGGESMHRTALSTTKNYLVQSANSAKVDTATIALVFSGMTHSKQSYWSICLTLGLR